MHAWCCALRRVCACGARNCTRNHWQVRETENERTRITERGAELARRGADLARQRQLLEEQVGVVQLA